MKKYYHQTKKQIIEQTKFTYSPLGKAFEKQIKSIEDQGKKIHALNDLKPIKENKFDDDKNFSKYKEILRGFLMK